MRLGRWGELAELRNEAERRARVDATDLYAVVQHTQSTSAFCFGNVGHLG